MNWVFDRMNMAENTDILIHLARATFNAFAPIAMTAFVFSQCGKKPSANRSVTPKAGEKSSIDGDKPAGGEEDKPNAPKAPADKDAVAGTHDPNYQTLAGVDGNVFQEKGKPSGGAAPAPKPGGPGMAATHDPNYQTLAGIGNDCFDKKK
uniref:Lipoprotein n=3 Tax=Caenorhabditis tropicalis TaxID=1561998 RepID=A0A1I7TKH5_9PELO